MKSPRRTSRHLLNTFCKSLRNISGLSRHRHPANTTRRNRMVGGLIRHTKAVVYFAAKLCEVYGVTGLDKDYVISACILHDVLKYGAVKQAFTTKNHDYEGAVFVREKGADFGLKQESINAITGCIAWHMGRWTDLTGREVKKEFPRDYTTIQMVTHLADVISAQKNVSLSHIEA